MIKFKNIISNITLDIDEVIDFNMSYAVTTKIKTDIDPIKPFEFLNAYLDYKGENFRKQYIEELEKSKAIMLSPSLSKSIDPLPTHAVHNILDLFNLEEVTNFLKSKNLVKIPSMLKDEFDVQIELNDMGSRDQTYLINDYIELKALLLIIKAAMGPIGEFAKRRYNDISPEYIEYVLFHFYLTHPIYETEPFQKLYRYISKLINNLESSPEEYNKRIIEKNIDKEEYPTYILASLLFQRLLIAEDVEDDLNKNIITKMYNFIKNRIKLKSIDNSSDIRFKSVNNNNIANEHESESVMETYRVTTAISPGMMEELNFAFSNPEYMLKWLNLYTEDNVKLFTTIRNALEQFKTFDIPNESIYIMSWIMKDIVDPRAYSYIEIENLLNALAVSAVWCLNNDHIEIAMLLCSTTVDNDNFIINVTSNIKLDNELKEILDTIFPYQKAVNNKDNVKYSSFIEETITEIANMLIKNIYSIILPVKLIKEYRGTGNPELIFKDEVKNIIAKLIIDINS